MGALIATKTETDTETDTETETETDCQCHVRFDLCFAHDTAPHWLPGAS